VAAFFELTTGLFNIAQSYPWRFFFPVAHYAAAWLAIGALVVHIGVKLPVIRSALGDPSGWRCCGWRSSPPRLFSTAGPRPDPPSTTHLTITTPAARCPGRRVAVDEGFRRSTARRWTPSGTGGLSCRCPDVKGRVGGCGRTVHVGRIAASGCLGGPRCRGCGRICRSAGSPV
jgi:hypothetical protein